MGEDRELVRDILDGRKGAMEHFVRQYQDVCWRVLYRLVNDREDARDLCQDTFMRAHRALPSFRFDASLKTWITRIAWTVGLRHLEKKRIPIDAAAEPDELAALTDGDDDMATMLVREEARDRVRAALDALPPLPRSLLTLYYLEDMALADIARVTGLPMGTIKSYLFRGRLALRQQLTAYQEAVS